MKILHIGLASHFTDGMNYQDEIMPYYNCKDGHTVTFISDAYSYNEGRLVYTGEEDVILENGLRLIRVPFDPIICPAITNRYMKSKKLTKIINELHPDSILYHGCGGSSLLDVVQYVKENPNTLFYVDCHASFGNSSKNILSFLFNKIINGYFIYKAYPYIKKILYVSEESKDYLKKMYSIEEECLEWFPLGGTIYRYEEKKLSRQNIAAQLNIPQDAIIYCHSGKISKLKKTDMLIRAFSKNKNYNSVMIILGSIENDIKDELQVLLDNDSRIHYLGWKTGEELNKYFLAADVYSQPGTVSASLQNAMCCGCAIISYPWPAYLQYKTDSFFWVKNENDIADCFSQIESDHNVVWQKQQTALKFAEENLDYQTISRRIYS